MALGSSLCLWAADFSHNEWAFISLWSAWHLQIHSFLRPLSACSSLVARYHRSILHSLSLQVLPSYVFANQLSLQPPELPVNCIRYTLLVKSQLWWSRSSLLYLEFPIRLPGRTPSDPWKSRCFSRENLRGLLPRPSSILGTFWGLNKRFYNYMLSFIFRSCSLPVSWTLSWPWSHSSL